MKFPISKRRMKIALKKQLKKMDLDKEMNHTITLYRVVGKSGSGYRRDKNEKTNLDALINQVIYIDYCNYENRRPMPEDSGIFLDWLGEDWLFAFSSLKDLNSWFDYRERRAGSRVGGHIQILKVDKDFVVKGVKQSVFHPKAAIEVKKVKLNHFDLNK